MKGLGFRGSCWLLLAVMLFMMGGSTVLAAGFYGNPYVTFSPTGQAWTTHAGDRDIRQYPHGMTVRTGNESTLRAPGEGEHFYQYDRNGMIPVGKWECQHTYGQCIHNAYPVGNVWCGVYFQRNNCSRYYFSGWVPYCADCGERMDSPNIYMSDQAAASLSELDLNKPLYYYLCPFCGNLEQGATLGKHYCKAISYNQYRVIYDPNVRTGVFHGRMAASYHMYNNATMYEGKRVTPVTSLSVNAYSYDGMRFAGWNTKPDGTGVTFQDGAVIYNLTNKDWKESGEGTIRLYAQWRPAVSTLRIDPAGGSYGGRQTMTEIDGRYLESYRPDLSLLCAPSAMKISFDTHGGEALQPRYSEFYFREWQKSTPFHGDYNNGVYMFVAPVGSVDTLTATYGRVAVTLPVATRMGYRFDGWYYDAECTVLAGYAGEQLIPDQNIILHAAWAEEMELYAEITRILEPHTPNFKRGESGILKIKTTGHAERVTVSFPEAMNEAGGNLDKVFGYSKASEGDHEENIQFMVPLYLPTAEKYTVTVRAYKGDKMLEKKPAFGLIGEQESVLNELRTRLR